MPSKNVRANVINASFVETLTPAENTVRTTRQEHDEIEVPILGPRGAGSLKIEAAQQVSGEWDIKKLEARLLGRAAPLDLLLAPAAPASARDEHGNKAKPRP